MKSSINSDFNYSFFDQKERMPQIIQEEESSSGSEYFDDESSEKSDEEECAVSMTVKESNKFVYDAMKNSHR